MEQSGKLEEQPVRENVVIFDQARLAHSSCGEEACSESDLRQWDDFFRSIFSLRRDCGGKVDLASVSKEIDLYRMEAVVAVNRIFKSMGEGRTDMAVEWLQGFHKKLRPGKPVALRHLRLMNHFFHADEVCSGKEGVGQFATRYADMVCPASGGCATLNIRAYNDILGILSRRPKDLGGEGYKNFYVPDGNFSVDLTILRRLLKIRLSHMGVLPMMNPVFVAGSDLRNDFASDREAPVIDIGERLVFEVREKIFAVLKGLFQSDRTTAGAFDYFFGEHFYKDGEGPKALINGECVGMNWSSDTGYARIITL